MSSIEVKPGPITIDWKVEKLGEFFGENVEAVVEKSLLSPHFLSGSWRLQLKLSKESPDHVSLFLHACFQSHEAGPSGTWKRVLRQDLSAVGLVREAKHRTWEAGTSVDSWGWSKFATRADLYHGEPAIRAADYLVVRCTFDHTPPPDGDVQLATATSRVSRLLFDTSTVPDVHFILSTKNTSAKRHNLVNKAVLSSESSYFRTMFSSGFAESAQASASSSVSSVMEVDKDASLIKVDKDDDDTLEWLADGWNEQVASDEKGEEAGGAASDGKIVVKIEDFGSIFLSSSRTSRVCADSLILRSYITYRAMLFYLYTRTIDFTPLASSFLVELDPKSENPLNSRRAFLLSKSTRTVTDIEPASAHRIYRLADKIDLQELKALAKKAIVDGFSILYELISTFAYHYDEIQNAAIAFALSHWDEVKSTAAFRRVVENASDIEGGPTILAKLLEGFSSAEAKK